MAELKEYEVEIDGLRHTFLLTEADAKARGAVEVKQSSAPANKARSTSTKSE